jgi:hypothetical protein
MACTFLRLENSEKISYIKAEGRSFFCHFFKKSQLFIEYPLKMHSRENLGKAANMSQYLYIEGADLPDGKNYVRQSLL